jgi:hypothetical protein
LVEGSYRREAAALARLDPAALPALWDDARARFAERLAVAERLLEAEDQRRMMEALSLARVMTAGVLSLRDVRPKDEPRLLDWPSEAVSLSTRYRLGEEATMGARVALAHTLRDLGRPDDAELALAPALPDALRLPYVAVEASLVSEARGRLEEAKERVRLGLAQDTGPELLKRASLLGVSR